MVQAFRRLDHHLIVLDTSPYPTRADADRQQVVLRHRDANAAFNEGLTRKLEDLCRARHIAFSYKDRYIAEQNQSLVAASGAPKSLGSTEMGRMIAASGDLVDGTTLQIPTTGYHTMQETAAIASCEAFIRLLRDVARI